MKKMSHTGESDKVRMVDVTDKKPQIRLARAKGMIKLQKHTLTLIKENKITKGNVLTLAQVAGIQSAKKTSEIIPLCHPLQLTNVSVETQIENDGVLVSCEVSCVGRTGVEMEALTAVATALLTIYDMCKAVDDKMRITDISLTEKTKKDE